MITHQQNPYIGPRTFQRNEGHLFFGRDREARDLISLVVSERLVVFYAQSGAGKSSIVNTRLIPNLEEKEYEVLPVGRVSGDSPEGIEIKNIYIYNLLRSIDQHEVAPSVFANLSLAQFLCQLNYDDKGYFYDVSLPDTLAAQENETVIRRALIIDQFEELFSTHPEAWEKREGFFRQLTEAMQDDPHLWVVLVMREDFIAAIDPYAHLVPNGMRVRYYMQRLGRDAALKAVTNPVETIRPYAKGVAEKLIDDLCSITVQKPDGDLDVQPGQYVEPVQLQVVCYGLWDNLSPDGKEITEKDLEDVGDVNQSLGKYYDRRVGEVAKAKSIQERMIREWFEKKLITAGGIRNMVLQERESKPGELPDYVIQALQSDLVRGEKRGGATWYELTHDRLVEPILERNKIWFNENLSPLQRQAALWKDQDQNESWLLRDHALEEVEEWAEKHQAELTETEREFLTACQRHQAQLNERQAAEKNRLEMAQKLADEEARSAKRARIFNVISGVLVVIAIIASVLALRARSDALQKAKDAKTAQDEAVLQSNIAHSGELSITALDRSNSQLDLSLLLGIQADNFNSNTQTQKTMLALMQKSSRYLKTIPLEERIDHLQFSPDGDTFASFDNNGVTFWNSETYQPENDVPINGHFSGVRAMALSADGSSMASGAMDGTIVIWNALDKKPLGEPFKAHSNTVSSLVISPDGKTLASASWNGEIILWDISTPEKQAKPLQLGDPLTYEGTGSIICLAFSPNGEILAAGNSNSTVILWNVETRKPMGEKGKEPLRGHNGSIYGIAFSPDGKILATGSYDDMVILWDIIKTEGESGQKEAQIKAVQKNTLEGHPVDLETIAMSPDGKTLASGDDFGNIFLWDMKTGEAIGENPLNGKTSWIVSLAFSPDNKTLLAGSLDGKVILWDVQKRIQIGQTLLDHKSSIWGASFNPDGKSFVTASEDSTILFWEASKLSSPQKGKPLQGHPGKPTGIHFSDDGSLLASDGNDATILLDVRTQKQVGMGSILKNKAGDILVYQLLDEDTDQKSIRLMDSEGKPLVDPILGQNPYFSPDESLLVYETIDPKTNQTLINLWDIAKKRNVGKDINGLYPSFSPDNRILIYQTSAPDTDQVFINLWSIEEERNLAQDIPGTYLTISSDNNILVYQDTDPDTGETFLHTWDIRAKADPEIGDPISGIYIGFNSTSQTLVYQTTDDSSGEVIVELRNIVKNVIIETYKTNEFSINPDGTVLAFRVNDAKSGSMVLHVVDTSTGEPIIEPVSGGFFTWSGNGNILLYTTYDNQIGNSTKALNIRTGNIIKDNPGSDFNYSGEAGDILAYQIYSYRQGKSNIVLINTRTFIASEPLSGTGLGLSQGGMNVTGSGLTYSNSPFDFSANGKYLIYGPDDGTGSRINVWDTTQNTQVASSLTGAFRGIYNDYEILVYQAVVGDTTNVYLYDLVKRASIGQPFNGIFLGISPDGKKLATLDENNSIVFWDTTRTWPLGDPILESGSTEKVTSATLSVDGKTLAFADDNGVTFQDVSTEKITRNMKNEHYGTVLNTFLSQDESILVTFGDDEKAIVWDLKSNQPISEPIPITPGNSYAYFSPKQKYVYVLDGAKNTTLLWDLENKRYTGEPITGQNVNFSPKETFVAIGNYNTNTTTLWDLVNQRPVGKPITGQSISFSSDGKYAAIGGGEENTLIVWRLPSGEAIGAPLTGSYAVFSPRGNLLALVDGGNNKITLWDLASQKMIDEKFSGQGVSFASDDQILAMTVYTYNPTYTTTTVLLDLSNNKIIDKPFEGSIISNQNTTDILAVLNFTKNTITFWDPETHKPNGATINGNSAFFRGTDPVILLINDLVNSRTILWNTTTRTQVGEPLEGIFDLQFSSDETVGILTDTSAGTTILLDMQTGEQLGAEIKPGFNVYPVICAANKSAAWFDPGTAILTVWDIAQSQSISTLEFDPDNSYSGVGMVFNSRCDVLAILDYNKNETTLWDPMKGRAIGNDPIDGTSVVFNSDGSTVAIGNSFTGTTTFWKTSNAKQIETEEIKGAYINFNPENSNIISIERYIENFGYRYAYWDLKSLSLIGNASTIYYPTFTSDGKLIVAGDKGVSLWDLNGDNPDLAGELHGHVSPIQQMRISNDGQLLASLASDGIVLTDLIKGSSVLLENGEYTGQPTTNMAFDPDGKNLTALGNDGTILIWDVGSTPLNPEPTVVDSPYTGAYRFVLSPDGKYLIYENTSNNLYIYDIEKRSNLGDPFKIETCCNGGGIAFTPDLDTIFFNDGGRIFRWDQWTTSTNPQADFSFGQNLFSRLNVVMGVDPENPDKFIPKYLVTSHNDQNSNMVTQIWDWEKNSKVGDPIPGNMQVFGSNHETQVLIYVDNEGRLIRFDLDPVKWKNLLCERAGRNLSLPEWGQYIGIKDMAYQKVCEQYTLDQ